MFRVKAVNAAGYSHSSLESEAVVVKAGIGKTLQNWVYCIDCNITKKEYEVKILGGFSCCF